MDSPSRGRTSQVVGGDSMAPYLNTIRHTYTTDPVPAHSPRTVKLARPPLRAMTYASAGRQPDDADQTASRRNSNSTNSSSTYRTATQGITSSFPSTTVSSGRLPPLSGEQQWRFSAGGGESSEASAYPVQQSEQSGAVEGGEGGGAGGSSRPIGYGVRPVGCEVYARRMDGELLDSRPKRKWTAYPGKHRFVCGGRVMLSRNWSMLLFTVFLISATLTAFFVCELCWLWQVCPPLPILIFLLALLVLANLLRTSFTDPGILPRATHGEVMADENELKKDPSYNPEAAARGAANRMRQITCGGQEMRLKYCYTCRLYRPPRASHCATCDACVLAFDHHCPWVGNCVGARNYRHFYAFISLLSVLCLVVMGCCTAHLIVLSGNQPFLDAVKQDAGALVVALICFFAVWSILGLSGFHTYLVAANQTTNEDIKGTWSNKRHPSTRNPFSMGVWRNCLWRLCGPQPPSLVDARGWTSENPIVTVAAPSDRMYTARTSAESSTRIV